jgi:hypothetical protein
MGGEKICESLHRLATTGARLLSLDPRARRAHKILITRFPEKEETSRDECVFALDKKGDFYILTKFKSKFTLASGVQSL